MTNLAPVPPMNLDAEESVLGAMMISKGAINTCSEYLTPADFYRQSHALIYSAIIELDNRDIPADPITVREHMESAGTLETIGGRQRIHELAGVVSATGNAGHYASIVRDLATLRGLIRVGQEYARMGYERPGELPDLLDQAEKLLYEVTAQRDHGELAHIAASLALTVARMDELSDKDITGLPTGLAALDSLTTGLQQGNLIVIGGRPSMGKSALALNITHHAAVRLNKPLPVAVFSLEMSNYEVNQRLISLNTGVPLNKLRKPKELGPSWQSVHDAKSRLETAPIYIDDSGDLRITELRSRARRLKTRMHNLSLIVVDYIQLMVSESGKHTNREQEVAGISRGLKSIARELDVPVVCLSQLNRGLEARTDKRPTLADLRESGAIEQDADVVIFVYRDEVYNKQTDKPGTAELIVAKQRQGPTGIAEALWSARTARFADA